jgi:hypothetical protein
MEWCCKSVFPFVNERDDVKSFYICRKKLIKIMETTKDTRNEYQIPSLRIITTNIESSFLQSNLEPIGGGDDPDIDW